MAETSSPEPGAALARTLAQLDLAELEGDRFEGDPGPGRGRLYGGLVAAQSVVAAGRTVERGTLHSLHAYFLRPGRHEPISFEVDRIRDGRSFTTRRVVAIQRGEAIFNLSASFAAPEEGIAHQTAMPDAPDPEDVPAYQSGSGRLVDYRSAVEMRSCDAEEGAVPGSMRRIWMRPTGPMPDDPQVHAALLVYASDRTLLSSAARGHAIPRARRRAASLDHAVWLHAAPRFDDWLLYATESPVARSARAWTMGAIYDRAGVRIATVTQEGLIRLAR